MTNAPAIFILSNDNVLVRLLILIGSLKYYGYNNEIYIIPYDDNIRITEKIANALGYSVYTTGLADVQRFARHLYDRDPPANPYPKCLGNLRKMVFLNYTKPAVYLDADISLTSKPDTFNTVFSDISSHSTRLAIGYINTSPTGVYEDVDEARTYLDRSHLLCAGILSKPKGRQSIESIFHHMSESRIQEYHKIRRRGGHVDQPVWNYLVDTGCLDAVDLLRTERASRVTNPSSHGIIFDENGGVHVGSLPVILFHMAGPLLKATSGSKFFWQGMLWEGLQAVRDAGLQEWRELIDSVKISN